LSLCRAATTDAAWPGGRTRPPGLQPGSGAGDIPMTSHLANRLTLFSAAIALAACSSAQSQELPPADAPHSAGVTQAAPPLEAAPEDLAEAPPPRVVPEAAEPGPLAPEQLTPQPLPPPPVVVAPVALTCHIDIMRTANGVRITPVMLANRAMAG